MKFLIIWSNCYYKEKKRVVSLEIFRSPWQFTIKIWLKFLKNKLVIIFRAKIKVLVNFSLKGPSSNKINLFIKVDRMKMPNLKIILIKAFIIILIISLEY